MNSIQPPSNVVTPTRMGGVANLWLVTAVALPVGCVLLFAARRLLLAKG